MSDEPEIPQDPLPMEGLPPTPPPPPFTAHQWTLTSGSFPGNTCEACGIYSFGNTAEKEALNHERLDQRSCPGNVSIFVHLDGDITMSVGDLWPDGDYPDEITSEAAAKIIKEYKRDMDLDPAIFVSVDRQEEVTIESFEY